MGLKTLNVMGKSQKEVNDSLPVKVSLLLNAIREQLF